MEPICHCESAFKFAKLYADGVMRFPHVKKVLYDYCNKKVYTIINNPQPNAVYNWSYRNVIYQFEVDLIEQHEDIANVNFRLIEDHMEVGDLMILSERIA